MMVKILAASGKPVEARSETSETWLQSMKNAIRTGRELCDALGISPDEIGPAGEQQFGVFVPLEFLSRMEPGNPNDPLLLQVLASRSEDQGLSDGVHDPVGDAEAAVLPGLLRKYQRRALVIAAGACAIHCRYCFRRHFPYSEAVGGQNHLRKILEQIEADLSLDEVILSGGDPLTLRNKMLTWLLESINAIPHIKRIRIHTRLPVVIPSRVDTEFVDAIRGCNAQVYIVVHSNHPSEFDHHVDQALERLKVRNVVLLNQAVLLRGVNDSVETLEELSMKLVDRGVLPYYLHQLDLVKGGTHFAVEDQVAVDLVENLRTRVPGYAVPTLVREVRGESSKTPV